MNQLQEHSVSSLSRSQWNEKRLQQFADREELSLSLAYALQAMAQDRQASFDAEVDRVVDPEFQMVNAPGDDA